MSISKAIEPPVAVAANLPEFNEVLFAKNVAAKQN